VKKISNKLQKENGKITSITQKETDRSQLKHVQIEEVRTTTVFQQLTHK